MRRLSVRIVMAVVWSLRKKFDLKLIQPTERFNHTIK